MLRHFRFNMGSLFNAVRSLRELRSRDALCANRPQYRDSGRGRLPKRAQAIRRQIIHTEKVADRG